MMKRAIAFLLCIVMLCSFLPAVSAQEAEKSAATRANNFVGYPSVFVVEDNYHISFLTSTNGMAWVEIGGVSYEDTTAGLMDWETKFHGITVPQSALDAAKSYKICFQPLSEKPANNPSPGATQSKTYSFDPVLPGEDPVLLCVSDQHNNNTGATAVSKYANYDVLVFGGDYAASINTEAVAEDFLKYSGEIAKGTKPVIYPRGNHEIRGQYTHWIDGVVPSSSTNKSYYEFVMGDVYGIVLDCGGSYTDDYTDIADTIDYEPYRVEQTRWLQQVYTKGTWKQYSKRIIVCHTPFVAQANFSDIYKDWTSILNRMDMSICISGHTHKFTIYGTTHSSVNTSPNFPTFTMTAYAKDPYSYTGGYLTLGDQQLTLKQVDSSSLSVLSTNTFTNKTYGVTTEPITAFETAVAPMVTQTVAAGTASVPSVSSPFSAHPTVFIVEDNYVISFLTTETGMAWVEVGGQKYKDSTMGVMDWESRIHSITIPQSILNSAKKYKICFQSMSERKAYTPVHGATKSRTYPFTPAPASPTYLCMSEQLNDNTNAMTVATYKNWDVFVCGGKYMKAANTENNRYYLLTLCGETTQGTKPTIYTRGNRELRGFGAHDVVDSMGTSSTGDAYFYFTQPNVFGIVLDTGEFGADSLAQFGGTVRCQKYREEQTQWLRKILAEGKWKDYDTRIVICHIPFTTYTDGSMKATFKEWTDILNEMGITLMIAGHVNDYAYHAPGDSANVSNPNFPMLTMSDLDSGSIAYSGTYVTFNGKTFVTQNVTNTKAVQETKTVTNPLYADRMDVVSNYNPINDQNVLYFGFGNTPEDILRYTTNPVYGNANYDVGGTIRTTNFYKGGGVNYDLPTGTGMGFNYDEGTVYSNITGPYATEASYTGNVTRRFVFGETNDTIASVGSLKYNPKNAEVFQVRFKLHNVKLRSDISAEERSRIVSFQYYKDSATSAVRNANKYGGVFVNDDYMVVTLDLDNSFKSASVISKLWVEFHGFFKNDENAEASVTLDYVYIGPRSSMPTRDDGYLLFDFTDSAAAQYRYSGDAYGGINYDLPVNWAYHSSRSSIPVIENGTMTATCLTAGHAWFETKNGLNSKPSMGYVPSGNEYVQVRLRFNGLSPLDASSPGRVTIFFFDASNHTDSTARSAEFSIPAADLATNGEWFTYHFKIGHKLEGLAKSDSVRIAFSNVYSIVGTGTVEIDYLYIGDEDTMPEGHRYTEVVTAPTCTENGYTTFTCADCGKSYVGNEIEAGEHQYETTETAPTCTENGRTVHTCSVCGYVFEETLEATGHSPELRDGVQPTCTEDGCIAHYACTLCGAVFADELCTEPLTQDELLLKKLEHNYTAETTEPDCTVDGVTIYTCANCGDSYEERIDAYGHTEVVDEAVAPTCTTTGLTEGKHCSVCGEVFVAQEVVDALGHTEVIDEAVAPTCTEAGLTEGKHCSTCGEILVARGILDALGHSYDEGKVTKEATCTEEGIRTFTCTCGDSYTESIAKLSHKTAYYPEKTATCTEDGYGEHYYCSGCNNYYTDEACKYIAPWQYLVEPATGHSVTFVPEKAATCTEDGCGAYYHCSACGENFFDEACEYALDIEFIKVSAFGHSEVIDEAIAPSCTESGLTEGKHCAVCGEVLVARGILDALGHSYFYTDNGENHVIGCEACDYSLTEGHAYTDGACICGAAEKTEPKYEYNSNLGMTMNISVGAEMQVMYTVLNARVKNFESFYVEVVKDVVGGESVKTVFSLDNGNMVEMLAPNGNLVGYSATYTGIFAMEMGDNFTATLYAVTEDGTIYYGDSESSSIKSYLMEKLVDSTSSDELKTLAVDMLNYGAAAQVNFNYDAENLVNADLTDEQKLLGTQETPSATDSSVTSGDGGRITTSVSLQSKVLLYVNCNYAKTENSNLEFVVKNLNGDVLERFAPTVAAAKLCQGVYGNVGARQMRDLITIELYDNGKLVSQTLTWNIESYVAQTRESGASSDALIATVNAMLAYGDSAAIYLTASGQ